MSRLVGIAAPTPHTAPANTASDSSLRRLLTMTASVTAKAMTTNPTKILSRLPARLYVSLSPIFTHLL
jgi:hypothetical protein